MTRLTIACIIALAAAVVATTCAYVLKAKEPSPAVIGALAGMLATLVMNGVAAIIKRNAGDEPA